MAISTEVSASAAMELASAPPSTPPQAGLSLVHGSTLVTSPTFTPAIRTGLFGLMFSAVVNTALTS